MNQNLFVERVEYENHSGQFWRQPAPKHTRRKDRKYHGGVSVSTDRCDHHAELYGTLSSGSTASIRVSAKDLHTSWTRVSSQRAEQFESELATLIGHKVQVTSSGELSVDYDYLKEVLSI